MRTVSFFAPTKNTRMFHKNASIKFGSLLWMAMFALAANAQTTAWNFHQILQAALTTHPYMLGKRSAKAAAKDDLDGAQWQRYPSPSLEASSQSGGAGLLRIDQPLWSGGRITASIDAAGNRLDAAGAAVDEARLDLTLRVIAASTEALRQQARQQHGQHGVDEHKKLLALMERRVAQEVSPLADQNLASSRLYAAANELSLSTQALTNALSQLAQLAGEPVTFVASSSTTSANLPISLSQESALLQALSVSPTLRRLAFEEEVANTDIASKQSAYLPQLVLRLEHSAAGQVTDNRAMLVLSAQPGAGLSARSGVQAALARREAARLAREAAVRDVRDRVAQDWNDWQASRTRLENALQAGIMSSDVSNSYARQFTAGRKSWIDVLNAVRETTQAEWAVDDAQAQVLAASLRLAAQTGLLVLSAPTEKSSQ